jgi:hypothetical protein
MGRVRGVLVAGVLAVAVSVVVVGPAVAAKGGNSENAHACQQGGHETRFEGETGRAFKNAGDCASHGAKGGAAASLEIVLSRYNCFTTPCWGTLEGSGLDANSTACVQLIGNSDIGVCFADADGDGAIDAEMNFPCGMLPYAGGHWVATGQVKGTTVTSAEVASPC